MLSEKKGLIAIALTMSLVVVGAFAAQYYTWTVSYEISTFTTPLTFSMSLMGGAAGSYEQTYTDWVTLWGSDWMVLFEVTDLITEGLEADFRDLMLTINVGGLETLIPLVMWGLDDLHENSVSAYGIVGPLSDGTYNVTIKADYYTLADTGTKSFQVRLHAREVIGPWSKIVNIGGIRYYPNGTIWAEWPDMYVDYEQTYTELAGNVYSGEMVYDPDVYKMLLPGPDLVLSNGLHYSWAKYLSPASKLPIKDEFEGSIIITPAPSATISGSYTQYGFALGTESEVKSHYPWVTPVPGTTDVWFVGYTVYTYK